MGAKTRAPSGIGVSLGFPAGFVGHRIAPLIGPARPLPGLVPTGSCAACCAASRMDPSSACSFHPRVRAPRRFAALSDLYFLQRKAIAWLAMPSPKGGLQLDTAGYRWMPLDGYVRVLRNRLGLSSAGCRGRGGCRGCCGLAGQHQRPLLPTCREGRQQR